MKQVVDPHERPVAQARASRICVTEKEQAFGSYPLSPSSFPPRLRLRSVLLLLLEREVLRLDLALRSDDDERVEEVRCWAEVRCRVERVDWERDRRSLEKNLEWSTRRVFVCRERRCWLERFVTALKSGTSMRLGRARRVACVSLSEAARCPIRPRLGDDETRASDRRLRPFLSSSDSLRLRDRLRVPDSEELFSVRLLERDRVDRFRDASRLDRDRVERSVRERDERLARFRSLLLRADRPIRVEERDRSVRAERRVRIERSASAERPIRPVRARAAFLLPADERVTLRSAA